MNRLSVLIPCYNEAVSIATVVGDFRRELPEAAVYVFDNNSTDGSAELAQRAGALVYRVPQQGKGHVVRRMFQMIDADIYVMVDGDDTYPAEDVHRLIEPIANGMADVVTGDRLTTTYKKENKRPFHNVGNVLVRFLIRKLWGNQINDVMTGYRAFSRRFVKTCPVLSTGFEIETEMTLHTFDKRFNLIEVPINYRDRPIGSVSKLNTFFDGFRVLKTIFNMFRFYRPLQFFGMIGLMCWIVGLVLIEPVLADYFLTGLVPRFPTLIFVCFLLAAGMMLFSAALLLDAIKKQSDQNFEIVLSQTGK